jgi:hypothetical protein
VHAWPDPPQQPCPAPPYRRTAMSLHMHTAVPPFRRYDWSGTGTNGPWMNKAVNATGLHPSGAIVVHQLKDPAKYMHVRAGG